MAGGVAFSVGPSGRSPEHARVHVIKTGGAEAAERFRVVHEVPVLGSPQGVGFHFISTVELTEHEVRTALELASYARSEIDARLVDARARFDHGQD